MESRVEEQLSEPVKREWKKLQTNLSQASERHYEEQRLLMTNFLNDMMRIEKRNQLKIKKGTMQNGVSTSFASPTAASLVDLETEELTPAAQGANHLDVSDGRDLKTSVQIPGTGPRLDKLRCSKRQEMQGALMERCQEGAEFTNEEVTLERDWLSDLTKHVERQAEVFNLTRSNDWIKMKQIAMSDMELLLNPLRNLRHLLDELVEPPRAGPIAFLVGSKFFEMLTCFVIILNCILTWTLMNQAIDSAAAGSEDFGRTLAITNFFFVIWYCLELSLRLCVHRVYFFCNEDWGWNIYDFVLVVLSTVEIAVTIAFNFRHSSQFSFARVARIFKVVRVFRVLKAMRFFTTPRLMLDCLLQSFPQVVWASFLLGFMLYIFSLLLVQALMNYLLEPEVNLKSTETEELLKRFGSIELGMLTLFEAVSGGDSWAVQYNLIFPLGMASAGVYLLYIIMFSVLIWNVFTGIVVQRIIELAAPDAAEELNEKQKRQLEKEQMLMSAFSRMDLDNSGSISLEEFAKAMADDDFRDSFKETGLDMDDVVFLFDVLTGQMGHENLDIRDVVMGSMKLKGLSSSLDSFTTLQMVKKLSDDTHNFILFSMRRLQGLTERLQMAEELTQKSTEPATRVHMDIASFSRGIAERLQMAEEHMQRNTDAVTRVQMDIASLTNRPLPNYGSASERNKDAITRVQMDIASFSEMASV